MEADTVAGVTGKACLVTLVDRKSRYLLCEKVAKKDSISVKQAIIHMLKDNQKQLHLIGAKNFHDMKK